MAPKTSELIWQDAQHQVLFDLIDQIESRKGDFTVFVRLREYADSHFSLEEEYMDRLGYPDREAHIKAHHKFREELNTLVENAHTFDDSISASLSAFLSEWLRRHIFGVDKKFEKFVLESDFK